MTPKEIELGLALVSEAVPSNELVAGNQWVNRVSGLAASCHFQTPRFVKSEL
jgi:nicotinamide mononucleotide adenylyltransferase